jgi:hypothetical protein
MKKARWHAGLCSEPLGAHPYGSTEVCAHVNRKVREMGRLRFWYRFLRFSVSPLFHWGAIVYAVLAFLSFVKDEFVPSPWSGYPLLRYLPKWPTTYWLLFLAIIIIAGVIEAAYAQHRISEETNTKHPVFTAAGEEWIRPRKPYTKSSFIALFAVIGCTLGVAVLLRRPPRGQTPEASSSAPSSTSNSDRVSQIEAELGAVPNRSYRRLVAAVLYALDPTGTLSVGPLVSTPDGTRKVDIEIRLIYKHRPVLVAVTVVNLQSGMRAGISVVDAADSERSDINADVMLVCSNTGFSQEAIRKAKRKHIGLISVLRQGDKLVKTVIEEEVYLRKIDINPVTVGWSGENPSRIYLPGLLYHGGSIVGWLRLKAALMAGMNPDLNFRVTKTFRFKSPASVGRWRGKPITMNSLSVSFTPRTQWLSETVQLDAPDGIYDYVRGSLILPSGRSSFVIRGLNFDRGTPISRPPPDAALGFGLRLDKADIMEFADVYGAPVKGTKIADLDGLIMPQDLVLKLTHAQIEALKPSKRRSTHSSHNTEIPPTHN